MVSVYFYSSIINRFATVFRRRGVSFIIQVCFCLQNPTTPSGKGITSGRILKLEDPWEASTSEPLKRDDDADDERIFKVISSVSREQCFIVWDSCS